MYVCSNSEQNPLKLVARWVQSSTSSSVSSSCAFALPHRSPEMFTTSFDRCCGTLVPHAFETAFLYGRRMTTLDRKKKGLSFSLQLQCLSVIFPYLQSWRRCLVTREQHSSVQGQGLLLPRPRSPQWVKVQQSPHRDALSAWCFTYTSIPKRLKTITWIRQWTSAWDSGKMRSPIGGFCEKAMNLYAGRLTAVRWWGVVWLP